MSSRWQIARRLKRAGLTARAAKALARVLRARIPRGAAFLDSLARAHDLESAGLAPSHAEILVGFLQPPRPLRRPESLFASHRTARALETAGIAGPAAQAIAAALFRALKRGTPVDSLTTARTLQNLGMAGPAAEAIAGLLGHMALSHDTLTTAATLSGAQVTTLALARDLGRAGLPVPQAEAIARHLYRRRYWPGRLAVPAALAAPAFEAAGFSAAEARVLGKVLQARASRPAPENLIELLVRPLEVLSDFLTVHSWPQ